MMIGSKGPCDALAQPHDTLFPNMNGVVNLLSKMMGAMSFLAAHCTRSLRAANHQGKIGPSIIILLVYCYAIIFECFT